MKFLLIYLYVSFCSVLVYLGFVKRYFALLLRILLRNFGLLLVRK